jgi:hypothetical protein
MNDTEERADLMDLRGVKEWRGAAMRAMKEI